MCATCENYPGWILGTSNNAAERYSISVLLISDVARMFLSRTVAAEICMEAKVNEQGYNALKRLDKEGFLRFELSYVI